jgi:hypothetical protein
VVALGAGDGELHAVPSNSAPSELRKAKRIIFSILDVGALGAL